VDVWISLEKTGEKSQWKRLLDFAKCTKWHTSDFFLMLVFENCVFIGVLWVFLGTEKQGCAGERACASLQGTKKPPRRGRLQGGFFALFYSFSLRVLSPASYSGPLVFTILDAGGPPERPAKQAQEGVHLPLEILNFRPHRFELARQIAVGRDPAPVGSGIFMDNGVRYV
jgi:hypothetical protein